MNTHTAPKKSQNKTPPSLLTVIAAISFLFFIAACMPSTIRTGDDLTAVDRTRSSAPDDAATVMPPDPALEPPAELVEQPLNGFEQGAPEVWLVPSLQSKLDLAAHIGVGLAQLDWVNPGLSEPVLPGTLIVVPRGATAYDALPRPQMSTEGIETRLAVSPSLTVSPVGDGK